MKFISHLDMTRFMSRLIAKSKIPVWYTEGFNQHIYMNFALPLSLGFEGLYEIVDIRLTDDSYSLEKCLEALKKVSPPDIEFISVSDRNYRALVDGKGNCITAKKNVTEAIEFVLSVLN